MKDESKQQKPLQFHMKNADTFNITFHNVNANARTLGKFFEKDGQFHFEGDCDESATIFVKEVLQRINKPCPKAMFSKTVDEIIKGDHSPLPLDVIPNHMGINLCSVDSISWSEQEDGQLTKLSINFIPSEEGSNG